MDLKLDTVVMVDWSGGNGHGPKPRKDAIWAATVRNGETEAPEYFRNRQIVETWLTQLIERELTQGRRLLVGFDFAFGYPAGFAKALTGQADPFAIWSWLEARIEDTPTANNRFDIAGQINSRFDGVGPFWGNGLKRDIAHLPRKGRARTCQHFAGKRAAEELAKGAFTVWQLSGAGAVGSQVLMGLPVLERLRRRFGRHLSVWPFEAEDTPVRIIEIWPSLINARITQNLHRHPIKDAVQVLTLAETIDRLDPLALASMLNVPHSEEGWIFGLGHVERLVRADAD